MFVYMNTAPKGKDFNFRGESDNAESFKAKMEERGHAVLLSKTYVSPDKITLDSNGKAIAGGK